MILVKKGVDKRKYDKLKGLIEGGKIDTLRKLNKHILTVEEYKLLRAELWKSKGYKKDEYM